MSEVPDDVLALSRERERARAARDFAAADALRERIRRAGFDVTDTASGPELTPVAQPDVPVYRRSGDVPSVLDRPPVPAPTVQWVLQGWPEDVHRGFEAVSRTVGAFQPVIVDAWGRGGLDWFGGEVVRVDPGAGWAVAQNAGLRRAAGEVVVLLDGSVEITGDGVGRLCESLRDPTVGVTGPFGIVTDDLHEFRAANGPEVDAVEGYAMAFRRELVERGLAFDEKFRFYRSADIELSFQVKALGLRATVTRVEVTRHEHRGWTATPKDERARLSKRNFYRFLDRWRGRTDLLVSKGGSDRR